MDQKNSGEEEAARNKTKLITYGVYCKLLEGIQHYDSTQTSYRSVASWLLLASIAVIGFVFSTRASIIQQPHLILGILVGALALIAVTIVGIIDLVFHERMMIANFIEAVRLERKHSWLPDVHRRMVAGGSPHGSPSRKAIFYVGCATCLMVLMGILTGIVIGTHGLFQISILSALVISSAAIYAALFYYITGRYESLAIKFLEHQAEDDGSN